MTIFQKALAFNAWQFNIPESDLTLDDWLMESNQEDMITENLPNLNARRITLLDSNENDQRQRFGDGSSRFVIIIQERSSTTYYGAETDGGYYEINEGQWLVENTDKYGYTVMSDEALKRIILPEW